MASASGDNESRWFKANSDSTVTVIFDDSKPIRFSTAYWSIHGLGAPIRMMLCAAKLNHINQLYNFVEDGDHGWKSVYYGEKVTKFIPEYTPFMNLPCLADEEEKVVITQLNACLYYLGNICGMMGQTPFEQTFCVQMLSELYDLRCTMTHYVYGQSAGSTPESVIKGGKEHFDKFEKHLQNKSVKCYIVGDAISAPDFHLFEMIEQYDALNKKVNSDDILADYPNVRTFFDEFGKLEVNQFYFNSILHTGLPFNAGMAVFGSDLNGEEYKQRRGPDAERPLASWCTIGDVTLRP